jgi:hypothetical protein
MCKIHDTINVARQVGKKGNLLPQLIPPSPGLCNDTGVKDGEPLNYYVMPGSSFVLEMKASDPNTVDNITIEVDTVLGQMPGYLTENMYDLGKSSLTPQNRVSSRKRPCDTRDSSCGLVTYGGNTSVEANANHTEHRDSLPHTPRPNGLPLRFSSRRFLLSFTSVAASPQAHACRQTSPDLT